MIHLCCGIPTPSGLVIDYSTTAYEFALLSGDDKAAVRETFNFKNVEAPDGKAGAGWERHI